MEQTRNPSPPGGRAPVFPTLIVCGLLSLNLLLLWRVLRTQERQEQRLTELEASAKDVAPSSSPSQTGAAGQHGSHARVAKEATADQRMAFLLASAGNSDESRRIIEPLSPGESLNMARALVAMPAANDRNAALSAIIQRIAADDPEAALGVVDTVQEPALRNALAVRATTTWLERKPDAAASWLASNGDRFVDADTLDTQLAKAVERWAAFDPADATKFIAAQLETGPLVIEALRASSREWGRKNPAAALDWAKTLPPADARTVVVAGGAMEGWAQRDAPQAGLYLQEHLYARAEGSAVYIPLAAEVADRWAAIDVNAAALWAAALPNPVARREAMAHIAVAWMKTDPQSASLWAAALPPSDARLNTWAQIATAWSGEDLDGAGNWISNLPVGLDRDAAVAVHANRLAQGDPEKALTWAQTITERDFRAQNIRSILQLWESRDAGAARNWAAANGIQMAPPLDRVPRR